MGRHSLAAAVSVVSILAAFSTIRHTSSGPDWQVENPFRFFKSTRSFALHEAAYNAARGNGDDAARRGLAHRAPAQRSRLPGFLVARPLRGDRGQALSAEPARLGGADAQRHLLRPQRAAAPLHPRCASAPIPGARRARTTSCPRRTPSRSGFAADKLEGVTGECTWTWRPRRDGGKAETKKQACNNKLTIARVPYSRDAAMSGVSVAVTLPDGRQFSERDVVVEDLFIVALGDSFASGESNPDRPVQFSAVARDGLRPDAAARRGRAGPQHRDPARCSGFGLASSDRQINPKVLPRRLMEDELAERFLRLISPEFQRRVRQGAGAVAQPRLPPLAIRLSGPRRPPARAGEPPPLGHARDLHLLRRRDRATACSWRWIRAKASASRTARRSARSSTS